ncbi:hypothetical protein [Sulfurivirga sp.]|uniref:hypothetical protein n=1 Tax=Sulfurivirga sp. TaxID=2614236 RepID=UPI0025EB1E29|nr:hypothetical protein [Sulfurivirga sp.]
MAESKESTEKELVEELDYCRKRADCERTVNGYLDSFYWDLRAIIEDLEKERDQLKKELEEVRSAKG